MAKETLDIYQELEVCSFGTNKNMLVFKCLCIFINCPWTGLSQQLHIWNDLLCPSIIHMISLAANYKKSFTTVVHRLLKLIPILF